MGKTYNPGYGAQDLLGLNDRAWAARRFGSAFVVGFGRDHPNHLLLVVDCIPQRLVRISGVTDWDYLSDK